jgi:hypothetical protein
VLDRPIQSVTPHSTTMKPNVTQPSFHEGGFVKQVDVWRQQAATPTSLLNPTTEDLPAVTVISYNTSDSDRGSAAPATPRARARRPVPAGNMA